MLSKIFNTYRLLSLDVVIGVMANALFAAKLMGISNSYYWISILCLATWAFYTADHLIDTQKTKGKTDNQRHKFHYINFKFLFITTIISLIIAIYMAFTLLDKQIIFKGLGLSILIASYFVAVYMHRGRNPLLQKEFFIALVYISGIWLFPLAKTSIHITNEILIIIASIFLLAWAEGIIAAYFDFDKDTTDGHSSFPIVIGKKTSSNFTKILLSILIIASITGYFLSETLPFAFAILIIMELILLNIISLPNIFQKNELYRIIGEMVFWLPALCFFI